MKMFKNISLILAFTLIFINANGQYLVPEYVQNYDNTKPTVYAIDLGGGYQQVADSAAKADIPSAKRVIGMMVTYKYGGVWVSERYEGTDVLNTNWRNESNWQRLGISLNLGTSGQVPYMNLAGSDLLYSNNFKFTGKRLDLKSSIGSGNIFIGDSSGRITTGDYNTFYGWRTGYLNISGLNNTFVGANAGYSNTASYNTFIGYQSGTANTSGTRNTYIGYNAMSSNSTGSYNTILGYLAGDGNLTGSSNIFIGYQSGTNETGSNKLYIENSNSSSPLIKGDFATDELWFNVDTLHNKGHLVVDSALILKPIEKSDYQEGILYYDNKSKGLVFNNNNNQLKWNIGREFLDRVYNESGAQINNGDVVTIDSVRINGSINITVKLAGNGSKDSCLKVAIATVDIPNNSFGEVCLFGEINGLNTSAFNNKEILYLGHAGKLTNIRPSPPELSLGVGYVVYADNDSGQIYIYPGESSYYPIPHVAADTSGISQTVTVTTQNVFYKLPINLSLERDNYGFIVQGDSISPLVAGHYDISTDFSFSGNPTAEVWNYGIFVNSVKQYTKTRSTSASGYGDVKVQTLRYLDVGDWVTFKIRNTSGTGDPVISDIGYFIKFLHE